MYVTSGRPKGITGKFINYMRSPVGRKMLEDEGFENLYGYVPNKTR